MGPTLSIGRYTRSIYLQGMSTPYSARVLLTALLDRTPPLLPSLSRGDGDLQFCLFQLSPYSHSRPLLSLCLMTGPPEVLEEKPQAQ